MGNIFGPRQSNEELLNAQKEIDKCKSVISKAFSKNVIVAEHGSSSESELGANSIFHAHIHIIPIQNPIDVFNLYYEQGGKPLVYKEFSSITNHKNSSYLYLSLEDGKHLIWTNSEKFSRQFVRKVCAEIYQLPEYYNWKKYPFSENIDRSVTKLKPYCELDAVL